MAFYDLDEKTPETEESDSPDTIITEVDYDDDEEIGEYKENACWD